MKQPVFLLCALMVFTAAKAQFKAPTLDRSPMDMSYYPVNYPVLKIQDKISEPPVIRVIYSRPQRNGRKVFGELVEYGKVWRLGANEATEVELYKDVRINGNRLKKGRYTLYCIPRSNSWTLIFNTETDIWGAFQYDEKKDVMRLNVETQKPAETSESFTLLFEKTDSGANMIMTWDDVLVTLPLNF